MSRRDRRKRQREAIKQAVNYPPKVAAFLRGLKEKFKKGYCFCDNDGCENIINPNNYHVYVFPKPFKYKTYAVCKTCLDDLTKTHGDEPLEEI